MSNLATMIMEGSMGIGSKVELAHSYDHENGAGLIAMESAEALRDIFESEFYVPNTCTIAAALEGASCVEESSQAAIMEASIKGAFEKIKQFFIKLKEKVKDFLHNIKRYLTGIFGNDEKWVKNYEKELTALSDKDLKDYEVKMYKYSILEAMNKADIEKFAEMVKSEAQKVISAAYSDSAGNKELDESDIDDTMKDGYEAFLKEALGDSDPDAVQKNAWSKMRSGATSDKDKETVKVGKSQISAYIAAIKSGSKDISAYDTMITKVNKAYDNAIKFVNDCEKKVNSANEDKNGVKNMDRASVGLSAKDSSGSTTVNMGSKTAASFTLVLRKYSSLMSKMQSAHNTINTAAKSAMQERNSAYKKALTGAFAYARKNKGGK